MIITVTREKQSDMRKIPRFRIVHIADTVFVSNYDAD